MSKIRITQSFIKALLDDPCPTQIKAVWIDKTAKIKPGEAMLKGSYFEHLCLGAGHAHDEITVTDLTRLKNGEKSVAQQRIDAQAEVFKKICTERPIVIKDKQIEIVLPYDDNYEIGGTIDFDGYIDGSEDIALFDIKLTSSLYREHTYGPFGSWSREFPHNMDFTQSFMYTYLYTEKYGMAPKFYYLVFDYKPESEYKIILKKIERMHIMELMESIRKTIERIEFYKSTGWEYNANYKNCMNCPLKNECPERVLQKPITEIT